LGELEKTQVGTRSTPFKQANVSQITPEGTQPFRNQKTGKFTKRFKRDQTYFFDRTSTAYDEAARLGAPKPGTLSAAEQYNKGRSIHIKRGGGAGGFTAIDDLTGERRFISNEVGRSIFGTEQQGLRGNLIASAHRGALTSQISGYMRGAQGFMGARRTERKCTYWSTKRR